MKYEQTYEEFKIRFKEQLEFLKRSSESYDNGFISEAKRLSVIIRILLHNTKSQESLLTLLNRQNMSFYDTASDYDPTNLAPTTGLVMMKFGGGKSGFIPPLDNGAPPRYAKGKVSFDIWWNKIVIANKNKNIFMTRRDLILYVCNKDGGAHVDRKLDKAYADLTRFDSLGWKLVESGIEKDIGNDVVLASIRQISHEVIRSLNDEFPEFS